MRLAELKIKRRDTRDIVELVAHELEHVLELLDGVNHPQLSQARENGVRSVPDAGVVFETERATSVGRAVAGEYRANAGGALACDGVGP